ncbi:premnaspirodiene oxygenase-like [Olea europaea subsp. europaea]|uniref:Premnaspirodiene oxygenase-like n=1 Tax=Olea europaea subsp. europaea TaxID=158383 RepID=A0A8S0S3K5_OLEEU|nr:premnaspirodiene oxygenase-like [Olea europaea subsp. europaea]
MDIQLLPFNFTTSLFLVSIIFLLVKRWKKSNSHKKNKTLPPTPWKLPLIGNMHQLVGSPPHHALRKLSKRYGPIVHLQLGEVSTIVVSSRETAKNVLKVHDPACADKGENLGVKIMWYDYGDIAFSPYNEHWRQMRKICILELLSAKNVRSFGSIRLDETSQLIEYIQSCSGEPVNLTKKISSLISSITCRAAFGQVLKDKDTLIMFMKEALALTGGFELADFFPSSKLLQVISWNKNRLWKMRGKLDLILDSMISEHKRNLATTGRGNGELGGEDIVDVLLRLQQSGELDIPITNENIKAIIFDLFSAGTETSSTTIDWAMAQMMRNPHVMAMAQAEVRQIARGKGTFEESDVQSLKYLKLVIKETLRLNPPFPLFPRACREECEVNGYTIPLKAKILINVWALGRDPDYWDEPESFKPERFESKSIDFLGNNFEFIPFGAGRRICPGMNFGLANVELPLALLLYHFNWKLPKGMNPDDLDMSEGEGISVPRKNNLYLIPTPYDPSIDG